MPPQAFSGPQALRAAWTRSEDSPRDRTSLHSAIPVRDREESLLLRSAASEPTCSSDGVIGCIPTGSKVTGTQCPLLGRQSEINAALAVQTVAEGAVDRSERNLLMLVLQRYVVN